MEELAKCYPEVYAVCVRYSADVVKMFLRNIIAMKADTKLCNLASKILPTI